MGLRSEAADEHLHSGPSPQNFDRLLGPNQVPRSARARAANAILRPFLPSPAFRVPSEAGGITVPIPGGGSTPCRTGKGAFTGACDAEGAVASHTGCRASEKTRMAEELLAETCCAGTGYL